MKVAMEPPRALDADVIRDEKLEVLQSLRSRPEPSRALFRAHRAPVPERRARHFRSPLWDM